MLKLIINKIEFQCETAAQLVSVATANPQAKNGQITVVYDSLDELLAATSQKHISKERRGKQGLGPERSWQEAQEYIDANPKCGMNLQEARSFLAKEKKRLTAEALLRTKGGSSGRQATATRKK